jgi:serine phosphatase RsbU (regulator of sigma subunit)
MSRIIPITLILILLCLPATNAFTQNTESTLKDQLDKAKNDKDEKEIARLYIELGDFYVADGDINKGQRHYNRSIRTNKKNKFQKLGVSVHRQYARSYVKEQKFDNAFQSYQEALRISKKYNLKKEERMLLSEIQSFKENWNDFKKAESEYKELKSLSKDDAIEQLGKQNYMEEEEDEKFLNEIKSLSKENQIKQLELKFKNNQLDKKDLELKLLSQNNRLKDAELKQRQSEIAQKEAESKLQKNIILFSSVGLLLLSTLVIVIILNNKKHKRLNLLMNEKNEVISHKNQEIMDSIRYAQRIQEAMLISSIKQREYLPESFIMFKPKDIVSGDFYWVHKTANNKIAWTAVDCTGHGVPGAFMSMVGSRLLNEIVVEKKISDPGKILDEMKRGIIKSLNQEGKKGESRDGMDMAVCVWDPKTNILESAGANNSIYLVCQDVNQATKDLPQKRYKFMEPNLVEIRANRIPIGYNAYINSPFDTVRVQLQKGDMIYVLSDGYQDQFGGQNNKPDGKKFTSIRLKRLMIQCSEMEMEEQRITFLQNFEEWMGDYEQVDDVCVIGVRI